MNFTVITGLLFPDIIMNGLSLNVNQKDINLTVKKSESHANRSTVGPVGRELPIPRAHFPAFIAKFPKFCDFLFSHIGRLDFSLRPSIFYIPA